MLRLPIKADYAIVALSDMCSREGLTTARGISQRYFLSLQLTANVLKELANAGFIEGKRGNRGGYILSKKPQCISVRDIIEVFDGTLGIVHCANNPGICSAENVCPSKKGMNYINSQIDDLLNNMSLQEIYSRNKRK